MIFQSASANPELDFVIIFNLSLFPILLSFLVLGKNLIHHVFSRGGFLFLLFYLRFFFFLRFLLLLLWLIW